jgi:DNA polymerase
MERAEVRQVQDERAADPAAWREAARGGRAGPRDLARAARTCRACGLWKRASQTVFGEGPPSARIVLVGEQPGDREDELGRPFVGPAGRLLEVALEEAGLDRSAVYVTNAVKHFKWKARGKRRLHDKPSAIEVRACRPWLEAEIAALAPEVIVCLGATAAQALLGARFRVTAHRGERVRSPFARVVVPTVHPAWILRLRDASERRRERERFVDDLREAATAARAR